MVTDLEIEKAARIIREGGTVVIPTETVYGLGADALSASAAARIFEIKRRPHFNPLIVHVLSLEEAEKLAVEFPEKAKRLARRFWPGPLTIVVPKKPVVPDLVTGGLPTVALRVPRHPVARKILQAAGRPIAAPSANFFGTVSPTTADHVRSQLSGLVDAIVDGGPCEVGLESTIVGFFPEPVLLRPGGVAREEIEVEIGPIGTPEPSESPLAPGMLLQHYSPKTPLVLAAPGELPPKGTRAALVALTAPEEAGAFAKVLELSRKGDLREAAAHLFSTLRALDEVSVELAVAWPVPDEGLGLAINDRLRRAAAGKTLREWARSRKT